MVKKIIAIGIGAVLLVTVAVSLIIFQVSANLPKLSGLNDYDPLLVSEVYDIKGKKIGEFFRERRIVIPYEQIPQKLVQAFVAAEDDTFFEHGGINYLAIFRSILANIKAGRKAQGGSTITQQVARSLILLDDKKTYIRKVREILLSYRIESNLTKEQILYLYLNQIYFGQGAYGVEAAAQSYFHKSIKDLGLEEMAILAGLPQAPSRYTPIANPKQAKARQRYVLRRMAEVKYITEDEANKLAEKPVAIHVIETYKEAAPFFLETVRQLLVKALGEKTVLDEGVRVYTTVDLEKQITAQKNVREGLRALDKRQGYRGPLKNLTSPEDIEALLTSTKNKLINQKTPIRFLMSDGSLVASEKIKPSTPGLPFYLEKNEIIDGVVTKVDDALGLVFVRFAENQGLITVENMKWARKPNPQVKFGFEEISKPSKVLKAGDVILVRVLEAKADLSPLQKKIKNFPKLEGYAALALEQDPLVEGSLLSIDLATSNIVSMVGGYDFSKSEFNRAIQAARQSGSSFKPIVYAAGLDMDFTPSTVVVDAPIVYQDQKLSKFTDDDSSAADDGVSKKWKPGNYGAKFEGDMLFRNALIQSRNIPTIKILEKVTVERAATYARRLGIFSPLNMDLSLGLGSSSVTLYEMTKAFSVFANAGKRVVPRVILSVKDRQNATLLENVSLDQRFQNEIAKLDAEFEEKRKQFFEPSAKGIAQQKDPQISEPPKGANTPPPIYFQDPLQLIQPQTAYLMTSIMQGVIRDPGGTGAKARVLGRPAAGKTGTTSGYYDAWFVGFTPQVSTGVWVGYDDEKSMGVGETGGDAALPIWIDYMKAVHEDVEPKEFSVPDHIVFANIDNETGRLASASSKVVIRQAYLEGTEPGTQPQESGKNTEEEKDFLKEDLSQ